MYRTEVDARAGILIYRHHEDGAVTRLELNAGIEPATLIKTTGGRDPVLPILDPADGLSKAEAIELASALLCAAGVPEPSLLPPKFHAGDPRIVLDPKPDRRRLVNRREDDKPADDLALDTLRDFAEGFDRVTITVDLSGGN